MPDALESVRAHAQHDLDGLFLFQMQHAKTGTIVPDILGWGEVEVGNVDSGDDCRTLWSLLQPAFNDLQSQGVLPQSSAWLALARWRLQNHRHLE